MTREDVQNAWEIIVEKGFTNYDSLTKEQKVWFNIEALTTGGIIDHYLNYGAIHNRDAILALEYLKFSNIAELMRKVNKLFKNGQLPNDYIEMEEQWNNLSDEHTAFFDEIDEEFFRYSDEIDQALLDHIIKTKIGIVENAA